MSGSDPAHVFYFAHGETLERYLEVGAILPRPCFEGAPPVVWCSGEFDFTASPKETQRESAGFVRFTLPAACAPVSWQEFVERHEIDPEATPAAKFYGRSPGWWHASYFEIPSEHWLELSQWDGSEWEEFNFRSVS